MRPLPAPTLGPNPPIAFMPHFGSSHPHLPITYSTHGLPSPTADDHAQNRIRQLSSSASLARFSHALPPSTATSSSTQGRVRSEATTDPAGEHHLANTGALQIAHTTVTAHVSATEFGGNALGGGRPALSVFTQNHNHHHHSASSSFPSAQFEPAEHAARRWSFPSVPSTAFALSHVHIADPAVHMPVPTPPQQDDLSSPFLLPYPPSSGPVDLTDTSSPAPSTTPVKLEPDQPLLPAASSTRSRPTSSSRDRDRDRDRPSRSLSPDTLAMRSMMSRYRLDPFTACGGELGRRVVLPSSSSASPSDPGAPLAVGPGGIGAGSRQLVPFRDEGEQFFVEEWQLDGVGDALAEDMAREFGGASTGAATTGSARLVPPSSATAAAASMDQGSFARLEPLTNLVRSVGGYGASSSTREMASTPIAVRTLGAPFSYSTSASSSSTGQGVYSSPLAQLQNHLEGRSYVHHSQQAPLPNPNPNRGIHPLATLGSNLLTQAQASGTGMSRAMVQQLSALSELAYATTPAQASAYGNTTAGEGELQYPRYSDLAALGGGPGMGSTSSSVSPAALSLGFSAPLRPTADTLPTSESVSPSSATGTGASASSSTSIWVPPSLSFYRQSDPSQFGAPPGMTAAAGNGNGNGTGMESQGTSVVGTSWSGGSGRSSVSPSAGGGMEEPELSDGEEGEEEEDGEARRGAGGGTEQGSREDGEVPRGAGRFPCQVCAKSFTKQSTLATHMATHTGEKPHVCPVNGCGRRFSVQSNMRRHWKSCQLGLEGRRRIKKSLGGGVPDWPLHTSPPSSGESTSGSGSGSSGLRLPAPVDGDTPIYATRLRPAGEVGPNRTNRSRSVASAATGGGRSKLRKAGGVPQARWLPDSLRSFNNAPHLSSRPPFPFAPAISVESPLPPIRPFGAEGTGMWEERDSFGQYGPDPYHPTQWTKLPGPALLTPEEMMRNATMSRRWAGEGKV